MACGKLLEYTNESILHLPRLYNTGQRRNMQHTPFTLRQLDAVLLKLQAGKIPGVDRLLAELYGTLPLSLRKICHLAYGILP